jgi:flagellar hook-basal body complex protein FliE
MSVPRIGQGGELEIAASELTLDPSVTPPTAGDAPDVAAIFQHQVEDASRMQLAATAKADALARGASDDLHGTMISIKEAEISMKLVGSVRNRLLDAFHELWRINL